MKPQPEEYCISSQAKEKLKSLSINKNIEYTRLIQAFNHMKRKKEYANLQDIFIIDLLEIQVNMLNFGIINKMEGE